MCVISRFPMMISQPSQRSLIMLYWFSCEPVELSLFCVPGHTTVTRTGDTRETNTCYCESLGKHWMSPEHSTKHKNNNFISLFFFPLRSDLNILCIIENIYQCKKKQYCNSQGLDLPVRPSGEARQRKLAELARSRFSEN